MSDTVLDLLDSPPAPEMSVDEQLVLSRGRLRVRRRQRVRVAAGSVAASCVIGLAATTWSLLPRTGGDVPGASPTANPSPSPSPATSSPVNTPNTSARQPVPCGTSATTWADTGTVVAGGDSSDRIVVHTRTCDGVLLAAGRVYPNQQHWAAARVPTATGTLPDRAVFFVLAEPNTVTGAGPNTLAYAALPPGAKVCGWSAPGTAPLPAGASNEIGQPDVLGLRDGWTGAIVALPIDVDASTWRMKVCGGEGGETVVEPLPVDPPAGG